MPSGEAPESSSGPCSSHARPSRGAPGRLLCPLARWRSACVVCYREAEPQGGTRYGQKTTTKAPSPKAREGPRRSRGEVRGREGGTRSQRQEEEVRQGDQETPTQRERHRGELRTLGAPSRAQWGWLTGSAPCAIESPATRRTEAVKNFSELRLAELLRKHLSRTPVNRARRSAGVRNPDPMIRCASLG